MLSSCLKKTHCSTLQEDDGTVISKLVHSCGRDSVVPTVFAVEALQAGSETTGLQSAFLLYHVARYSSYILHYYLRSLTVQETRRAGEAIPGDL